MRKTIIKNKSSIILRGKTVLESRSQLDVRSKNCSLSFARRLLNIIYLNRMPCRILINEIITAVLLLLLFVNNFFYSLSPSTQGWSWVEGRKVLCNFLFVRLLKHAIIYDERMSRSKVGGKKPVGIFCYHKFACKLRGRVVHDCRIRFNFFVASNSSEK